MTDRARVSGSNRIEALLIAGPTASGKSALAMALATRLGGLVINADSMQVYRDLALITARPTEAEERVAPHALYGTVDGATNHSVSRWLADAKAAMARAHGDGTMPIFVGGTGLYFKALTQGLSEIPPVPAEVRADIRAWAEARPPRELHAELTRRDPATAALLRPTDPQRLLRALEVNAATGASLAALRADRAPATLDVARCAAVFLEVDRTVLRTRIDHRFEAMMTAGALDEVRALAARRLDPVLPVMHAHGVPPLLRHLVGACDLVTAVAEAQADTRRYIKRQATFARHQLPAFAWRAPHDALDWLLRAAAGTEPSTPRSSPDT